MRFPVAFWIRVAGERYHTKRVRHLGGGDDKGGGEADEQNKKTKLLHHYPTLENELVTTLHENTHEIVSEYGIASLDLDGDDKDEDKERDLNIDRIAQGRAQFILSLIEQDILQWGPAMTEGGDDKADRGDS